MPSGGDRPVGALGKGIGVPGVGFDFQAGQIQHSIANGLAPQPDFLGCWLIPQLKTLNSPPVGNPCFRMCNKRMVQLQFEKQ